MASMDSTDVIHEFLPEFDWECIFSELDEFESIEGENTQIMDALFHEDHAHALMDAAAAKKRKRIQSIVFSEKMRRKRMRQFLAKLSSILPIPNSKVARYCLIEETIKYIEKLQRRVRELKEKRELLLAKKNCHELNSPSPSSDIVNVDVEVYGDEVLIRIISFKMPSYLWKIYQVIEAQHFEIQSVDVYRGDRVVFLTINVNCSVGASTQLNTEAGRHSLETDLKEAYG